MEIVKVPNAVLGHQAKTVTKFDASLKKLIAQMKKTLVATKKPKGVGLAAPQVGESVRVFITKPNEKATVRVFINPKITSGSDGDAETDNKLEGCLSIPEIWGKVQRSGQVTLTYQDEKGEKHEEAFTGFMATIVQHETDHTNGILFTQRVLEQKGKLYQTVIDKDGKETLEEINI